MSIDLHTHSNHSDGSFSPSELVEAVKGRCEAIALTDHNTVSGITEFLESGRKNNVETVAGIELSTEFEGKEFHLVGLFIPIERLQDVEAFAEETKELKRESNRMLAENLSHARRKVSIEELQLRYNTDNINRAHFAKFFVEKHYSKTVGDAFKEYLTEEKGFYSPAKKPETTEAIAFLKSIGALSILAHPYISADDKTIECFVPIFKENGLDGMECRYTEYDAKTQNKAEKLAEKLDLLKSGGSDFHGEAKPEISLLNGKGDLYVPAEYYLTMKAELDKHRAI